MTTPQTLDTLRTRLADAGQRLEQLRIDLLRRQAEALRAADRNQVVVERTSRPARRA